MTEEKYWIAINGGSCAISQVPWVNPVTVPVAQQYLGFPTLEEAKEAQRICLHEPATVVEDFLKGLGPDVKAGRIRAFNPPYPQPPTHAETVWMESELAPTIAPISTGGSQTN